ncbi:biotin--[acetyl-CoA-carboxylase] ligase [uncultured Vagococcus sp.]|uniref:biotin--[acetyl-CoA-carboxylase] ligase n=1 Tax=uncultured Vagococcus sp. TaxID=189676 RepID=UPI0028CFEC02|nr:biotin--[acetyl-CoA-carboxylase] ligase [uncultured Vagococcus sp.]
MSTKSAVLTILLENQGTPISGETIATKLSLSRTAIWKAINELKKEGHHIESVTNQGYTYLASDVLTAEGINLYLAPTTPKLSIQIVDELESTNQTLKKMAIDGAPTNTLLLVNKQTKTRGRFGREYFAVDSGQGVYFSLLLHANQQFSEVAQYTLITAVAIARAIEHFQDRKVMIKWVNDVFIDQQKVCGILSEAMTDVETQTIGSVIIGAGTNYTLTMEDFPEELRHKATSVFPDGYAKVSRNQFVATFLNEFYQLLANQATQPVIDEYRERSLVLGREVTFTYNRQPCKGTATTVNDRGELVVNLDNGEQLTLSSGEISLTSY